MKNKPTPANPVKRNKFRKWMKGIYSTKKLRAFRILITSDKLKRESTRLT